MSIKTGQLIKSYKITHKDNFFLFSLQVTEAFWNKAGAFWRKKLTAKSCYLFLQKKLHHRLLVGF